MPTIELTEGQQSRLEALQEQIESERAGYTTVTITNVISYLLDLSDAVEDPNYTADSTLLTNSSDTKLSFPREQLKTQLRDRKRKHDGSDEADSTDLYTIATEYEITGRSRMTKDELVMAVLDEAERRYCTPFASIDPTLAKQLPTETTSVEHNNPDNPSAEDDTADQIDEDDTENNVNEADGVDSQANEDDTDDQVDETDSVDSQVDEDESDQSTASNTDIPADNGSKQLNTMLSLLQTHDDKWSENSGDARYEVQLPDGSSEAARTKDDVRALLFKNYT